MDVRQRLRVIWDYMTGIPADVPDRMRRYYVYWKFFYVMAGVDHLLILLMFYQSDVHVMVIFNLFSVTTFVAAFLLLRAGHYQLAYWSAIGELILHGIVATLSVGPQFSFTSYTFLVVVLVFIQPFYAWRVSFVLAALTLASAAGVTSYGLSHPPLYTMTEEWSHSMIVRQVVAWPVAVLIMVLPFIRASARTEKRLAAAYVESNRLLLNILPEAIAKRLSAGSTTIADERANVSVLFADIVGFTSLSDRLAPTQVVSLLSDIFNAIDGLVEKHGLEKIKTIGDTYMVAAGLPDPIDDPEGKIARLALEIVAIMPRFTAPGSAAPVQVRVGISSGRVVAGVIGNRKFAYDLWGDAVNVAARMEATSEPGRVQVTQEFAGRLDGRFAFERRREIDIKGKGRMQTCFLLHETRSRHGDVAAVA